MLLQRDRGNLLSGNRYFDLETLHGKGDTEAADKFFMETMDMSAISSTFYNHVKGSTSIKILRKLEPLQPIWIRNVMHNSSYRRFKDMSVLCAKGRYLYDVRKFFRLLLPLPLLVRIHPFA